jgi:aldose 1-epimerase
MKMGQFASYQDVMDSGFERVVLTGSGCMVQIAPKAGFNLYSWIVGGREYMMPTQNVGVGGAGYGNPILFPTPNRTRDCTYTFQGETHTLMKDGKPRFIHGLVMDEPFAYKHWADDQGAYCEGTVVIAEGSDMASGYPYPCELTVKLTLCEKGILQDFTVKNNGAKDMPFGVAIHPYFTKAGDASQVYLSCPAAQRFEADKELLPTGVLIDVAGDEKYDLGTPRPLSNTDVDTVYLGMADGKQSRVEYRQWGTALTLGATDDFGRVVVYTPPYRPGFCIEPQTCSTDFINLYAKGFEKECGIQILPPNGTWQGQIRFGIEKL